MTDIAKILKDAPKNLKLYSVVHGEVTLKNVDTTQEYYPIDIIAKQSNCTEALSKDGKMYYDYKDTECILYPSKEHKSWDEWQLVLFNIGNFVTDTRNNESYILTDINQNSHTFTVMNAKNIAHDELPKYFRYATQKEKNEVSHELTMSKLRFNLETQQFERTDIDNAKEKKFTIDDFKPFDKVLVRDTNSESWYCNLFSHFNKNASYGKYEGVFGNWIQCIPYNDETKHLLGTTDDAPDKYKTW